MSVNTDAFAHRASEWDSPEKIKMTEKFVAALLQYIQPQSNWKALEIGAGTGLVGLQLENSLERIIFEDTSPAMLSVLQEKLSSNSSSSTFLGEITALNETDFDFVFSCMAFHHIPDITSTIQHLYRICKSGAYIAIGDLITEDGSFHYHEPIPHKGFDIEKLSALFVNNGFDIVCDKIYNTLRKKVTEEVIGEFPQFLLIAKRR